jgi:hypothetical protein
VQAWGACFKVVCLPVPRSFFFVRVSLQGFGLRAFDRFLLAVDERCWLRQFTLVIVKYESAIGLCGCARDRVCAVQHR